MRQKPVHSATSHCTAHQVGVAGSLATAARTGGRGRRTSPPPEPPREAWPATCIQLSGWQASSRGPYQPGPGLAACSFAPATAVCPADPPEGPQLECHCRQQQALDAQQAFHLSRSAATTTAAAGIRGWWEQQADPLGPIQRLRRQLEQQVLQAATGSRRFRDAPHAQRLSAEDGAAIEGGSKQNLPAPMAARESIVPPSTPQRLLPQPAGRRAGAAAGVWRPGEEPPAAEPAAPGQLREKQE